MTEVKFNTMIAVYERNPYWGPELKRQFEHLPIDIGECRSVSDLDSLIYDRQAVLVVLDFDTAPVDCLAWLGLSFKRHLRQFPIIVCGSAATSNFEWSLRELGAAEFLNDVIPGDQFGRLCRWQLDLHPKVIG